MGRANLDAVATSFLAGRRVVSGHAKYALPVRRRHCRRATSSSPCRSSGQTGSIAPRTSPSSGVIAEGTWVTFTPQKTSTTSGKVLTIPLLKQLREVLDASSRGVKTFLETGQRKPFTANGFGNWFRDRCNEAGPDQCTSHALRKAGAVIAAENGATIPQMMAISGGKRPSLPRTIRRRRTRKSSLGNAMHLLIAQKRVSHSGSIPKGGTTDSE